MILTGVTHSIETAQMVVRNIVDGVLQVLLRFSRALVLGCRRIVQVVPVGLIDSGAAGCPCNPSTNIFGLGVRIRKCRKVATYFLGIHIPCHQKLAGTLVREVVRLAFLSPRGPARPPDVQRTRPVERAHTGDRTEGPLVFQMTPILCYDSCALFRALALCPSPYPGAPVRERALALGPSPCRAHVLAHDTLGREYLSRALGRVRAHVRAHAPAPAPAPSCPAALVPVPCPSSL